MSHWDLDAELNQELNHLRSHGLHRRLRQVCGRQGPSMNVDGRQVLMLAGSNSLDLAGDPRVVKASIDAAQQTGCAAGGARLISGNLPLHESLERDIAQFSGAQAALLYSTGYMANLGVLTALAGPDDVIVSDALNHASIIDACRLSRAEIRTFRHSDTEDFYQVARSLSGFRRRLLVVDGVFSMDGDVAPLDELTKIARQYDMAVVVDDAHGFGVLGEQGRGATEGAGVSFDAMIGNLGKALGSFGAFVACSGTMREYLINRSRTFIYTCGLPASSVAAARAALQILADEPQRRTNLLQRAAQLRDGLREAGYDTGPSSTHIVPAIVGENDRAMRLCESALEEGVYTQAIRYPSVPRSTARLRLAPMCSHTSEDIAQVIELLSRLRAIR